jgi:signal transduction histidine kinase/DNA-binding response OmpR family regulator
MGSFQLSLRAQLLLGFAAVLIVPTAVAALAFQNTRENGTAAFWVRHTEQVIDRAQAAHLTVADLHSRYRDYLLSGNPAALDDYLGDVSDYHRQLDDLAKLTADNPSQAARWRSIEGQIDRLRVDLMDPGIAQRQELPSGTAPTGELSRYDQTGEQQRAFVDIGDSFDAGVRVEHDLLAERTQVVATGNAFILRVLLLGSAISLLLGAAVALWFARGIGSAMARLADGARAISDGDLARRVDVRRRDEIGEVGTAFNRMAAALQRDRAEREAVERLKDEFVSVVSHELRTPLTSIRGSLGLLHAGLMGPISPKAKHMLDVALSNTDRLIRLINDILDIERMRSGRIPMELARADARELVHRSIDGLKDLAESASVTLVAQAESIPLTVDADRIVQTLTNLISNAIKFSPAESRIEIGARRTPESALFSVKDYGRGIPPEKLEAVFGRFEQVDTSDAREKGGSGLGLAISRNIVQLHGGDIWVESTLGEGSTFWFTLPLAATSANAIVGTESATGTRAGPHVLIVDDDPTVVEIVSKMLAAEGYWPIGATSGIEALKKAREDRPDAILLDLVMPGMSGWDVLQQLKADEHTRDVPVVVLSGLERTRPPRGEPIEGWIPKPVTSEGLDEMLERLLQTSNTAGYALIVEDDADLARVLCETFEHHGLESKHAATSERAVELTIERTPDLMLLDLGLGDGDGFEVVDWFREHDRLRQVPIVVYTARDLSATERDRLQLGRTEFVTKGRVSPEDVQRRVLRLVRRVVPAGEQHAA